MNDHPNEDDPETEVPKSLQDSLVQSDVEVLAYKEGRVSRPNLSCDPSGEHYGTKLYLSISKEMQQELGIQKPADYVAVIAQQDGSLQFFMLSPRSEDEDKTWNGTLYEGFISRAGKGLHAIDGVPDEAAARQIVEESPLTADDIAAPFFAGERGKMREFAVINPSKSEGKLLSTNLPIKDIEGGYSQKLQGEWQESKEKKGLGDLLSIVVPNAVARLLGIPMTRNVNSPGTLGKSVADGAACKVSFEGREFQVFVGGALDSVGLSPAAKQQLGLEAGEELMVDIVVGQKELVFTRKPAQR